MLRTDFPVKKLSYSFLLSLFIAFVFSSCAHLSHLDRAQDAFSKGAEIENAALFNPSAISATSPESYYNLAYAEADEALKFKGKLQKVNVLGTTYSIKALSAWKLRNYQEARDLAKTAKRHLREGIMAQNKLTNYPRDYAVMEAMDALITIQATNDSVFQLLDQSATINSPAAMDLFKALIHNENTTGKIESALSQLDKIIGSVSKKHEVRTYFNMSQLGGLKVWSDAMSGVKFHLQNNGDYNGANKTWYEDQEDLFLKQKENYLNLLAQKLPNGMNDPVYTYWKFIL